MSFLPDIVDGIARLLAAKGVATYRPTGIYTATETAITDSVMPDSPDRAIVLTAYDTADREEHTDCTVFLQVRTRARQDPREVANLDEDVFGVIHGLRDQQFGQAAVRLIKRDNTAPMGADSSGRHERSSNYTIRAQRPTTDRLA
ncbi:MAG TPA: minor capsid protein [Phytomonospora sp.]